MTQSFEADDLFKRSIFSSIIGFGRRPNRFTGCCLNLTEHCDSSNSLKGPTTLCQVPQQTSAQATSISTYRTQPALIAEFDHSTSSTDFHRSKQDIYNEIVCECRQIEEMKVEPISDGDTGVTSVSSPTVFDGSAKLDESRVSGARTNITIENLVDLVVKAVKESGFFDRAIRNTEQSSENVLKKKRIQNNEAAARYRKRQKELKEEAELELRKLTEKNNSLKEQMKVMQAEIDRLKGQILHRKNSS